MKHTNYIIDIPKPKWDDSITTTILELEKLRNYSLSGSVANHIFLQIKAVFQFLETLASARIEGNNTTIAEAISEHLAPAKTPNEKWQEITNLDCAMKFIQQQHHKNIKIDKSYIFNLHKLVTQDLSTPMQKGEGSQYIGQLRKNNIEISKSNHKPPNFLILPDYFNAFIDFINKNVSKQNHLLMIAIAHHRFMYMHPFDNGTGRVGRLLNYSLLMKLGYESTTSLNIFNPSALFFANRKKYYNQLSQADTLKDNDILSWCTYFLDGLRNDLYSMQNLLDKKYITSFLTDILNRALEFHDITPKQYDVLLFLIKQPKMSLKSSDLDKFGYKDSGQKTYFVKKLRNKKILKPLKEKGRIYTINLFTSKILMSAIFILRERGFIHESLN